MMMLKQNITQGYLPMSYSKLFLALLSLVYLHLIRMGHAALSNSSSWSWVEPWFSGFGLSIALSDLGYYSTVSRHFSKWIDVLHDRLSVFVRWPERDQLIKTMPMEF